MHIHMLQTALLAAGTLAAPQTRALIYRGPAACDGCPEAIAHLLQTSNRKVKVTFAGPDEETKINADTLSNFDLYAQAGGPDLDDAWEELKSFTKVIQEFVSNGGRYLGFCLGAYLAGHSPGFQLLPHGIDVDSEIEQPKSQVKSAKDTVTQVDWRFTTGPNAGQTQNSRWLYFQEGAVVTGLNRSDERVLARYSSNGDVAATLTPFGKGWVGLVGPHPEATKDWYSEYHIKNPDGIKFDIGHDFVEATMRGFDNGHCSAEGTELQ
ncbi:hypothetical protein BGZ63DRAFT_397996 [Mariannaea sp. PMI_226]|nr:hypothetical protein BGZ63DRAFT_397996 [Mariannaea sp. PMI_226]